MTTSFAHFVRGHFVRSAQANAAGFLLAAVCAAGIPLMARLAVTGRQVDVSSVSEVLMWIVGAVTVVSLIQWFFRLLSRIPIFVVIATTTA